MKKTGLLNSSISEVISRMGHTDTIAIGECSLPIPDGPQRIDIALIKNVPTFIDTLKAVLTELNIDEVIIASEMEESSPAIFEAIKKEIGDVRLTFITHEGFKERIKRCKAVIRTGEHTSYANIILKSGTIF
jgi:D-ribose pyranase